MEFQSTFPRGERPAPIPAYQVPNPFQSTFPRGERRDILYFFDVFCNFNPRSRVGNDKVLVSQYSGKTFQSTFPRGERLGDFNCPVSLSNFNPRSRVGNDGIITAKGTSTKISIHVPAWGTTLTPKVKAKEFEFQSTFPRGDRRNVFRQFEFSKRFQSTFPRGERRTGTD